VKRFNLIHSFNPISIVGLRDFSHTTIRSTRIGGHTLARVDSFIVKRAREVELEKRGNICKARARIPRQLASTIFKAAESS
jgi:hypothetical protein